jgi:hypothetical protein
MKKHFVIILFLLVSLSGFANTATANYRTIFKADAAPDNATLLLENPVSGEIESTLITGVAPFGEDFVNCTIKIKMEIDGVEIEGKLTIYDVSLIECAIIKIGKFFSDLF